MATLRIHHSSLHCQSQWRLYLQRNCCYIWYWRRDILSHRYILHFAFDSFFFMQFNLLKKCSGSRVESHGFTEIMPWLRMNDEKNTIDARKGDSVQVVNIKLEENKTTPPSYLSEAELISLVMKLNTSIDLKKLHSTNISLLNRWKNMELVQMHRYQRTLRTFAKEITFNWNQRHEDSSQHILEFASFMDIVFILFISSSMIYLIYISSYNELQKCCPIFKNCVNLFTFNHTQQSNEFQLFDQSDIFQTTIVCESKIRLFSWGQSS